MSSRTSAFWAVAGVASIFLQFHWSSWILALLPTLKIIQFPWRFSAVTLTAVAVLTACTWDVISQRKPNQARLYHCLFALGMMFTLVLGNWLIIHKWGFFRQRVEITGNDLAYSSYTGHHLSEIEDRADRQPLALIHSQPLINAVKWRVAEINSRQFTIQAQSNHPTTVVINLVCFPGWSAFDIGKREFVAFGCDPLTGLRTISLPAGDSRLQVYMSLHWLDYWGRPISLLTALGLCGLLWWSPNRIGSPHFSRVAIASRPEAYTLIRNTLLLDLSPADDSEGQ
jgi:hypothetical protein